MGTKESSPEVRNFKLQANFYRMLITCEIIELRGRWVIITECCINIGETQAPRSLQGNEKQVVMK